MSHVALATAKTVLERTSLEGFCGFFPQLGGISVCKPSAVGFALAEIKVKRQGKEQVNREINKLAQVGKNKNNHKTRDSICEAGQNMKMVVTFMHIIRSSEALHLHPRTRGQ